MIGYIIAAIGAGILGWNTRNHWANVVMAIVGVILMFYGASLIGGVNDNAGIAVAP